MARNEAPHLPADGLVGHDGSEHVQRPDLGRVEDAEAQDDRPHPTAGRRTPTSPRAAPRAGSAVARSDCRTAGTRMSAKSAAATPKLSASMAMPQPGPTAATTTPPNAAPRDHRRVGPEPVDGVRRLVQLRRNGLRHERRTRRKCKGGRGSVDRRQRHQEPEVRGPGEHYRGDTRLGHHRGQAGADKDELARHPVGDDATEEEQHYVRQRPGTDDQAEVGSRAGQVKHRERERDRRHRVAGHAHYPRTGQQAERTVPQRRPRRTHEGSISNMTSVALTRIVPGGPRRLGASVQPVRQFVHCGLNRFPLGRINPQLGIRSMPTTGMGSDVPGPAAQLCGDGVVEQPPLSLVDGAGGSRFAKVRLAIDGVSVPLGRAASDPLLAGDLDGAGRRADAAGGSSRWRGSAPARGPRLRRSAPRRSAGRGCAAVPGAPSPASRRSPDARCVPAAHGRVQPPKTCWGV